MPHHLTDLGPGFGLVPLTESNVSHERNARRQLRRQFLGDDYNAPLPRDFRAYVACNTDVMALQAAMILRAALRDMAEVV